MGSAGNTAWRLFLYVYGALVSIIWIVHAILDGSAFRRPNKKVRVELAAARDKLWNLSAEPLPGFKHALFTTDAGVVLHYVVSSHTVSSNPNLIIFLHGFPDSWALWSDFLQREKLDEDTVYVAADLPGYGGSDSLDEYNAYNVLEAMASFIMGMRDEYATGDSEDPQDRGQVLLVSHDWGAVVACRLAAEAPQLADHFVVTGVIHPLLARSNAVARLSSAKQMLRTFSHHPLSSRPRIIRNALTTLSPLANQLRKSHYVFAFSLPSPFFRIIGILSSNAFLRFVHRSAVSREDRPFTNIDAAEAMANSIGPAPEQCTTTPSSTTDLPPGKGGLTYPASVRQRTLAADNGWSHKLHYYRDGLVFGKWTKSLQTILSLSALEPPNAFFRARKDSAALIHEKPNGSGTNGPATGSLAHRRRRSSTPGPRPRSNSLSVGGTVFDPSPPGALKAPTTLIVGARDVAFDWRLGLEGMAEYLGKGGAVVSIEDAGHWLVKEQVGLEVLGRVVKRLLGDPSAGMDGSAVVVEDGRVKDEGVRGVLRGVVGVNVLFER